MKCINCQYEINENEKVCPNCGETIEKDELDDIEFKEATVIINPDVINANVDAFFKKAEEVTKKEKKNNNLLIIATILLCIALLLVIIYFSL